MDQAADEPCASSRAAQHNYPVPKRRAHTHPSRRKAVPRLWPDCGPGAPPRKKTLKELEEADARAFSAPPPTASLYGVGTATR